VVNNKILGAHVKEIIPDLRISEEKFQNSYGGKR
jgi:hypothetical protein